MGKELPLPFFNGLASGLDALSGVTPLYVNFLADAAGAGRMRPGVQAWSDFGEAPVDSPVIGIYPWRQWIIFVTEDRQIWAWQGPADPDHPGDNILALSDTDDDTTMLDGTGRPIFVYDQMRVAIAGGGAPQQWQGVSLSSRLASGEIMPDGSPLALTHLAYIAERFVGNDNNNSGIVQWTDALAGNHGTWPVVGANYAEAAAAPDPCVAVYSTANELFAFGTETTQVYVPDAVTAFATASAIQVGCSAPYGVIETEEKFAWLDDRHRFVTSLGRRFEVISTPTIANEIMREGFVVSDCFGFNMMIGTWDLLCWSFPTEETMFAYDKVTKKWVNIRGLDENGDFTGWAPTSYHYWPAQNKHLVGLSDGTIGEVTFEATTDNGTPIKAVSRTGFQDRGTFKRKLCRRAQLQIRRGETEQPGPAPSVELRYRDDLGAFRPVLQWSMGVAGDYQPIVDQWNCGQYRQREWELVWSGGGPFIMTGATETIEIDPGGT